MLIQTLLVLLAFASIFGVIAGISKDRVYLLPMAGILLLSSGMLFTSGDVQIQDGQNITEEQINENITEIDQRDVYYSVDDNYQAFNFSQLFGVILLIISVYSIFLGADLSGTIRRS